MKRRRAVATRQSGRDTITTDEANQFVVYHRKELWCAHIEGGKIQAITNNELVVRKIIEHFEAKAIRDSAKSAQIKAIPAGMRTKE